ncbi:LPXTG cell wall anchor domain-containing protein [Sporosarcina sp. ACRSM]|uniref:collagen binding domain-containing protein n=1 Tax=Sporosarcina sp. ACRSM TaxID=2918216 RepID=UPI001EF694F2|nr:collagen binding domain-containing protein [Sporosarcina sp. ACRSM]MCG7336603.1 LPXTG cell wall anchor domain-containing protein [Sporosarcina sp. ACRSM]
MKKLSIFVLMLLIIGQTILGPIATVSASEIPPLGEGEVSPPEEGEVSPPGEGEVPPPGEGEVPSPGEGEVPPSGEGEVPSPGEGEVPPSGEGEVPSPGEGEVSPPGEGEVSPPGEGEVSSPGEGANVKKDISPAAYEVAVLNATFDFANLIVNGVTITNAADAANVTTIIGDKVDLNYTFSITADKDYEVGSTFSFELPQALLNFDSGKLSGTLSDPETGFSAEYTTVGSTVTITTTERLNEAEAFTGTLHFVAHFSEDGTNGGLEQELNIPIVGKDSIKIPFIFKPTNTEQSMSKSGVANIKNGERYINWEVWTNREGANLQDAELDDTLSDGHELEGSITVEKFIVGLFGVGASQGTSSADGFPVNLDDGRYAYKLTYETKVTRAPINETETFTNLATLTNGPNADSASASATHTYGTKLDKVVTDDNKYNAKWEIKYNYFGSIMASQILTDTVTGPHKIKAGTIKVYNVSVNAAGEGTKGSEVSNPQITPAADSKSFTVSLPSPNGEAYLIEYETELDSEFVTEDATISNEASYDDNTASDDFWAEENIFSKSMPSVNYDTKEITWTISVNVEKSMDDFVIEDDFTSYTEGGTRQKLVNHDNNPFNITSGVTPIETTLKGTNGDAGFTLKFGNLRQGQNFTIRYKTTFDILPNGSPYEEYKNTAVGSWTGVDDGKSYTITKSEDYKPGNTPTGKNGYKNGKFDHENQVFNWNLAVNINKQDIKNAQLVDVIEEGHELVPGSIKIQQLNLGVDDQQGTPGAELTTGHTVTENVDNKGFSISFDGLSVEQNHQAYIITYQTKDSDDIIGYENGNSYENTATFTTPNSGRFPLKASTTVKHANELIGKRAETNPDDETITWTVNINKSHSALGEITLTDKMTENQLILPDTFQMREIIMDEDGNLSYGAWITAIPTINSADNSFTLDLGNLNQKGYQIEYKTFFLGGDGDLFSNEASINYSGNTTGVKDEAEVKDEEFNFNDSSGTISSVKGKIELHKVGLNPLTGVSTDLDGITFELWNKTGTIKVNEATTANGGRLTFDEIRYGKYLLKESGTPNNYISLPTSGLEITMGNSINFNVNGNKFFVVENIEDIDMDGTCSDFTITVRDVDGNTRENVQIKFVKKGTGEEVTATSRSDSSGQISVPRVNLPAGIYDVFEIDSNNDEVKLDEVLVQYEDCQGEVQPAPKCDFFTITVWDGNGTTPRPNIEVTVRDQTTGEIITTVTTDSNGQIKLEPDDFLPAGTYDVYDGNFLIDEIKISYLNDNCGASVQGAPYCEDFKLTLLDRGGNPRNGVDITVKDANGNDIEGENGNTVLTTDTDGVVKIPNKIERGTYRVYEGNHYINSFTVKDDCEAEVRPRPIIPPAPTPTCDAFTVTVKQEGVEAGPDVELTLKSGATEVPGKTNANGKIVFAKDNLQEGTYTVLDKDGNEVGSVTVSYTEGECQAEIDLAPKTCDAFTITVKQSGEVVGAGTEVTLKDQGGNPIATGTTDADGKIVFDKADLPEGTYTVYDKEDQAVGTITVSYTEGECQAPIDLATKTCDAFTLTVKQSGELVEENTEVTLKDQAGSTIATGTTDANGKIIFDKADLPAGTYIVHDEVDQAIGTITVSYTEGECQTEIDLAPKICDAFTITVKQSGELVEENTEVTLKDQAGNTIATGTTDVDGKIIFEKADLPAGTYTAFDKDGSVVGTVAVSYEEGKCQAELDLAPSQQVCTAFTLTIQNRNSSPQVGVSVTIKDSSDHIISYEGEESFVTDQNGQITIGLLTSGAYKVYVDGSLLGEFTVSDTCSAIVKPRSSGGGGGGGGGGTPPTKPEEPSEPDNPGETEESEDPKTSEPGESGSETPGPGTIDPDEPGTETPGTGTTEPGTPGAESPGTSITDPGTPGAETPSVSVPGLPGAEATGTGEGKPGTLGSGDKAENKLPQTGEAYPIGSMAGGLGAIALGAWLLFRRKREVQS